MAAVAYPLSDRPSGPPRTRTGPRGRVVGPTPAGRSATAVGLVGRPAPRPAGRQVSRPVVRPAASVYRRRRLVALVVLATAAIGVAFLLRNALAGPGGIPFTTAGSSSASMAHPAESGMYVVRPGDTLWSIARSLQGHGDLRPLVDQLEAQTGHQPLQVGEQLVVHGVGRGG